ncbi:MAG: hypothetical protein H6Q69_1842 [Firmicutes bacterium]|nr:hypothetical protein [Bacillota bacterium]
MHIELLIAAAGIAILPPIWATLSPYIGIDMGWVSLACASVFVANGNKVKDAGRISVGFLMGIIWGILVTYLLICIDINKELLLFSILFTFGGLAVIIAGTLMKKIVYLPAWLGGWAITLGIFRTIPTNDWFHVGMATAVSMVVGVFYVGVGVLKFQSLLTKMVFYNK